MKTISPKTSSVILKAVQKHGPITSPKLAEKLGKTIVTIDFHMRALHRSKPKRVYVADLNDTDGRGRNARLWAAGDLPDAEKPKSKRNVAPTEAEVEAQWAAEDAKMRRAALAENRVHRDPFIEQFYGSYA